MDLKEMPSPAGTHNAFLSSLDHTPALRSACTSHGDLRGYINSDSLSPLKLLRLVSRRGRAVASRTITAYDLTLNREPGRDMSKMVQLLDGALLESLEIKVVDPVLFRSTGHHALDSFHGELQRFIFQF